MLGHRWRWRVAYRSEFLCGFGVGSCGVEGGVVLFDAGVCAAKSGRCGVAEYCPSCPLGEHGQGRRYGFLLVAQKEKDGCYESSDGYHRLLGDSIECDDT